jgi:hypothetical protein
MEARTRQILRWSTASDSARGSSHERSGTVNQDAVAIAPHPSGVVVAVADGHGSSSHIRSDVGSQLAVTVACEIGSRLLGTGLLRRAAHEIVEQLSIAVAAEVVELWRERVAADVAAKPWSAAELAIAPTLTADPHHGYGTTLMLAVAGEQKVGLLQLGDGDIVVARASGAVGMPIPGDDRLIGNQTTSMCLPKAAEDFRAAVVELDADAVRFVSLTTDGYSNSFASGDWATDVGGDLLAHLDAKGLEFVEARLQEWLAESAQVGGDDVTMGLLVADIELVDALELDVTLDMNAPGSGPVRDLDGLHFDATTQQPGKRRRRVLRPLVLVPVGLLVVAGAAVATVLTL